MSPRRLLSILTTIFSLIASPCLADPVGQSANELPSANFRADFPLKQIRDKTFKNETVQIDGTEFINCTFDNVIFDFEGEAPFRFTDVHFEKQSKVSIRSNNPVVKATLGIITALEGLKNSSQPNENK